MPWVYVFCKSASHGAETTYYCCLDREIGLESGKYYKNCKEVGVGKFNAGKSKKLWEVSERLTEHYVNHVTLTSRGSERTVRKPRVTFEETNNDDGGDQQEE